MKTNHFLSFATVLCISLLFSCTEVERDNPYDEKGINYKGGSSDSVYKEKGNDIANYRIVQIDDQVWMAENLDYKTEVGSVCNDHNPANCKKYGRLYDWYAANEACPAGWHLPSDAEWEKLIRFIGGGFLGSNQLSLRATSGWYENNGTDTYGFTALPGGGCLHASCEEIDEDGYYDPFVEVGYNGYWWSSTKYVKTCQRCGASYFYSYVSMSFKDQKINQYTGEDGVLEGFDYYSVRCVKN